jgi:hypothetical protein
MEKISQNGKPIKICTIMENERFSRREDDMVREQKEIFDIRDAIGKIDEGINGDTENLDRQCNGMPDTIYNMLKEHKEKWAIFIGEIFQTPHFHKKKT